MNSRAAAAQIVFSVVYRQQSLSDILQRKALKQKDSAYIKSLAFGTLRFWFQLQSTLSSYLEKPLKEKDKDVECLITIGLYQLLLTDTPPYAAIHETVAATKILKKTWAKGLVNKILRLAIENHATKNFNNPVIQYAHPNWLIEKIKADWPNDWEKILLANNQQPPMFLRVNQQKITLENFTTLLKKSNIVYEPLELPHAIKITNPIPVEKIPGFSQGFFSVQDLTGQQSIMYLAAKSGDRILDACCAPGSKTTYILETEPALASLTAVDISEQRLKKVSDNLTRLTLPFKNIQLISADICDVAQWWDKQLFDRILVDAPCSASGVIRRHPDIKILRQESDIAKLAEMQLKILNAVWSTLKSGGRCLYTTCSIFRKENDCVIKAFLAMHPDAQIEKIKNDWGIEASFGQQILPGDLERDGFYYAILIKD